MRQNSSGRSWVETGCDRIGASRTAEILDELKGRLGR
jgi:deoxyribose-phosphate aldolase